MSKSSGQRRKGGSHGSLSKAGKIRDLTPINWRNKIRLTKDNKPHHHNKKHKHPRSFNRQRYEKMLKGDIK